MIGTLHCETKNCQTDPNTSRHVFDMVSATGKSTRISCTPHAVELSERGWIGEAIPGNRLTARP